MNGNYLKTVEINSPEERELLQQGYVLVERDDKTAILQPRRRAVDVELGWRYRLEDGRELRGIHPDQVQAVAGVLEALGGSPGPLGEDVVARVLLAAHAWAVRFRAAERSRQ